MQSVLDAAGKGIKKHPATGAFPAAATAAAAAAAAAAAVEITGENA